MLRGVPVIASSSVRGDDGASRARRQIALTPRFHMVTNMCTSHWSTSTISDHRQMYRPILHPRSALREPGLSRLLEKVSAFEEGCRAGDQGVGRRRAPAFAFCFHFVACEHLFSEVAAV